MRRVLIWRRFVSGVVLVMIVFSFTNPLAHADQTVANGGAAWPSPTAPTLKRVGDLPSQQEQPNDLSNLACTLVSYRMVGQSTMRSGCFTATAFGLFDGDDRTVIFNGTDEGLPLYSYTPNEVLEPWPKALQLVTLDASDYGGSYLGIYQNPLSAMADQRNNSGQLTAKVMTKARDIALKDPAGQLLRVNPQTISFSDNGSWMAVETLEGSFVRINLATLEMTAFAQSFGSQGSPALLKSQVAISDDGRFVSIGNNTATSLIVYDLSTCNGVVNGLQPQSCRRYDYWPFVKQQVAGFKSLQRVRFINDDLLSLGLAAGSAPASGTYELAPNAIASLTDYIGLGDSYTSGEGAFDYLQGTDTDDNKCHLSVNSYPLLAARDLFGAAGGHSVACSGAVIDDVSDSSGNYRGQVKNGMRFVDLSSSGTLDTVEADFSPGYIAQYRFAQQYQPAAVTVSVGGNDIGFGDILQNCVEPHISLNVTDQTCYNTYESREEIIRLIDRTVPRWIALYKQLRAVDPEARIYAIGYPSIASSSGSCGGNVKLSKDELTFSNELVTYLDGDIAQAAASAGVTYVDINQALAGHRLCEASGNAVAMNGLTAGNDMGAFGVSVLGHESYHPNALGQQLIEQTILHQTSNLTSGQTSQPGNSSADLLNAPVSGAPLYNLTPDDTVVDSLLRPGSNYKVTVDGARDGLKPNSSYSVRFDGVGGTVAATTVTDGTGNLSTSITIPAGLVTGGHTIDITGSNQAGELTDVTQPVYIGSAGDTDGDGVPDESDSCPYIMNSGQDADHDQIDDVCDAVIKTVDSGGAGPGGTISVGEVDSAVSLPNHSSTLIKNMLASNFLLTIFPLLL